MLLLHVYTCTCSYVLRLFKANLKVNVLIMIFWTCLLVLLHTVNHTIYKLVYVLKVLSTYMYTITKKKPFLFCCFRYTIMIKSFMYMYMHVCTTLCLFTWISIRICGYSDYEGWGNDACLHSCSQCTTEVSFTSLVVVGMCTITRYSGSLLN